MSLSKEEDKKNRFEKLLSGYTKFGSVSGLGNFLSQLIVPVEGKAIDGIKRVILDRFIFTPPFILLFLYVVTILEGHGHEAAITKIKETYWTILKLNWRIWTIFQFINVNYVPQKACI
ncbi:hypothetical protein KUTeg_009596 [Tegillarca granosa]|uniref:Uncharacterized protein n=1 Tax=Tegillarca granosa TaxID=220873 RepID=A0ABQ9F9F8_TEGGR|nr:hypothetical protein KUTeg_009596 [Tegillarca granosa]